MTKLHLTCVSTILLTACGAAHTRPGATKEAGAPPAGQEAGTSPGEHNDAARAPNDAGGEKVPGTSPDGPLPPSPDASVGRDVGGVERGVDAAPAVDMGVPSGAPVFVLAGEGALRAVSRDRGRTWVDLTQEVPNGGDDQYLLRGIGCGNGLCIAGGGTSGATGRLFTTADGKTWRLATTGQPGISDVAYGNGIWVAVSGGYAARSTDGYRWDVNTDKGALQLPDASLRKMRFCGRRFVTWGDRGKCYASEDGMKWDACQRQGEWSDIAFGAGQCVAAGARRMTSSDGITWQTQEEMNANWIVWTGERFVAGAAGRALLSPDGTTWTSQTGNPPEEIVTFGAGVFVSPEAWSTDGVRWTASQRPASMNGVTDIDFTYF